ncbi:MAG TPA: RsmD family RNA methyltransferase [Candidatus Saccharimonadales bacterium]|nr:RsmD family RNA methyltransferase [Candidatus Saccharimonadales bacterium]
MRVIGGKLGGRQFDSPHGHRTHPMSDKIRGALFNSLGDINGLTLLDAYAGSGAISFEAISRGAKSAVAIEQDGEAFKAIGRNIKALNLESQVTANRLTVKSWSQRHPNHKFDIVVMDPPYNDIRRDQLRKLASHTKIPSVIVISLPPLADAELDESLFHLISVKSYGDAKLVFYQRTG